MTQCRICDHAVPLGMNACPSCGAPVSACYTAAASDFDEEILRLLAAGRKLDAVRRYQEQTGASLRDAKIAVETLPNREHVPESEVDAELLQELLNLLGRGKKIEAIKRYRAHTGTGLADAKREVESLAAQHGIVGQGAGCGAVLATLAAAFLATMVMAMVIIRGWH